MRTLEFLREVIATRIARETEIKLKYTSSPNSHMGELPLRGQLELMLLQVRYHTIDSFPVIAFRKESQRILDLFKL